MSRLLDALAGLPYGIAKELDPEAMAAKPFTIIGDDLIRSKQTGRPQDIADIERLRAPVKSPAGKS